MTEQERKVMLNLADTIRGEVNRMCVTRDLSELDSMALHARKNIEKLQDMRYADFRVDCGGKMTREEAAEILSTYPMNFHDNNSRRKIRADRICAALDMAIDALKAEPRKDGDK